jgi:phosphatidylglycerophosphate synthase
MASEQGPYANNTDIPESKALDWLLKKWITPNHITVAWLVAAFWFTVWALISSKPELVIWFTTVFALLGKGADYADGQLARYIRGRHKKWWYWYQWEVFDPLADKASVYVPNAMMAGVALYSWDTMAGVVIAVSTILLLPYDVRSTLARGTPDWKVIKETLQYPFPYPELPEEQLVSTEKAANIFGKSKAALQWVGSVAFMLYPLIEYLLAVGWVAYALACVSSLLSKQQKDKNNSR